MASADLTSSSSESERAAHFDHRARTPDIEQQPRVINVHYPGHRHSHTPVYTTNSREFRGVQITTFANADTLVGILRHYNANGRGHDVWRSRYKVNRYLREEAARSSRNEVRIDTDPRTRPQSRDFRSGTDRRDDDDDDDYDRRFWRGGPRPGGGSGGHSPDHVYMTAAGSRPTRSRGSVHIVEAQEMPHPERRYSREHGRRVVVDDRNDEDRDLAWVRRQERAPRRRTSTNPTQHKLELRGGGKPIPESEVPSYFFMFDRGKPVLIKDEREVGLNWSNQKFLAHLRAQFRALHYGWVLKPYTWVQDIGMIYVLVWVFDERTRRIRLLNKAELVESPNKSGSLSAHDFRYVLNNPPPGKCFAQTVARFLQGARGAGAGAGRDPRVVLMFEFANLPRARVLVTLALFTIPISAVVGILYGALQGNIADAISLASYIATASSLFFAILGAGSLLGIEQPHAYTATDDLLEEYVMQRRIRGGLFYVRDPSGGGNEEPKGKDAVPL